MDKDGVRVYIQRNPVTALLDVWITMRRGDRIGVAQPLAFEERPAEDYAAAMPRPTMELQMYDSEQFMLSLAAALQREGYQTPRQIEQAGVIEAMREHIGDLRQVAGVAEAKHG